LDEPTERASLPTVVTQSGKRNALRALKLLI
jgi:hypothetical protein